ncbi:MAG TPA: hypothetical protein VML75_20025 [Kofleriaceae bacterium]|nr:hypothetical protein [Kofleriaceae bacterium]
MSRLAAIGLVLGACSQPAGEPARAAAPAGIVIDAAPEPVPPPDAGVRTVDAVWATFDATAPSVRTCTSLPNRTAKSTDARRYTPGDFLGKNLTQIEAELGAPDCRLGDAYQWTRPRGCTDWRLYVSVWFESGRARHVVLDNRYTGEHCVYDF